MEAARPATEADVDAVAALADEGVAELRPMRGGDVWAASRPGRPIADRLRAAVAADDELLLAGTLDDVVLGYALARVATLTDGRPIAVVDDVYVDPAARGVGLGEALVEALVTWARDRGCIGIDAVALPGHRETKNFFEAAGFTARLLLMHKPL